VEKTTQEETAKRFEEARAMLDQKSKELIGEISAIGDRALAIVPDGLVTADRPITVAGVTIRVDQAAGTKSLFYEDTEQTIAPVCTLDRRNRKAFAERIGQGWAEAYRRELASKIPKAIQDCEAESAETERLIAIVQGKVVANSPETGGYRMVKISSSVCRNTFNR
jgi:hypothetical protein